MREHIKVLPHWMFLIDQLIRDAVKHVLESINKGKITLCIRIIHLVRSQNFPEKATFLTS